MTSCRIRLAMVCVCGLITTSASAQEQPTSVAPWISVVVSSLEDFQQFTGDILAAAGKPELADVLAEQSRETFREFAGIEPTRPLGWSMAWPRGTQPGAQFVALPVADREALVNTITGEDVDYRWEGEELAVIDRPEIPYHIWFHDSVAWLGDDVAEIRAVARRQQPALVPRAGQPLLTCQIDLRQIPLEARRKWLDSWRQSLATQLQRQNAESDANYRWRRHWGDQIVELLTQLGDGLQELQLTLSSAGDVPQLTLQLTVNCAADTPVARQFSRWSSLPTEWAGMTNLPDTIASGGLRWDGPLAESSTQEATTTNRSEIGWAVFGLSLESRVLLVGLSGKARDWFEDLLPQVGPNSVPQSSAERITVGPEHLWWRRWLQVPSTAWISRQGDQRLWLAFGSEDASSELLWSTAQQFRTWPVSDPPTPLKLRVSSTWLSSVVTGQRIYPKDVAQTALETVTLQVVPTRRPGELRIELQAPLSAVRHVGQSLISELASELEQRLQPLE